MRTTTKEFKNKVQVHIVEHMEEKDNLKDELQNVIDGFKNYYQGYEKKRTPNIQEAFIDWLNGLPSELTIEFTNYDILRTMREWHEQTEEESDKLDSEKVINNYRWLIFREFLALCRINKIDFHEQVI